MRALSGFTLAFSTPSALRRRRTPRFTAYPFSLGVASGDPAPDGFVLWTRLAPDPLRGGGMTPEPVTVGWEVAADDAMRRILRRGTVDATPGLAHSVHVEVRGLPPDRWYWYRFHAGGATSPVGRSRTFPAPGDAPSRLRFAFASCQHYEQGYYTAYRHMAAEDLELVVHLGDYIYEYAGNIERVRMHTGAETETLEDYRNRYALYQADPDLQVAHALFPWIVTWDDHEVDNNYAGSISEKGDPPDRFLARRAAAYQAYYEHLPLRRSALPRGAGLRLYRSVPYGSLAAFHLLDTRQYRSDQPCGDGRKPACPGVFDPGATLLGEAQERWLTDRLAGSTTAWNVLAQQTLMARLDTVPGPAEEFGLDNWNGYQGARRRLLEFLRERGRGDTVVLTGDIHASFASELKPEFSDPAAPVVAAEYVGTSISSGGDGAEQWDGAEAFLPENPHLKYHSARRGYVRCEVTGTEWRADYRLLPYVSRPDAPVATRASFLTRHGVPGVERA